MIRFYTLMCVLGLVLPYAALFGWLFQINDFGFARLWQDIVVNRLSLMGWLDVVVTAVVVIAFVRHEGRRLNLTTVTAPIVGTCLVGPSLGLPLFLLMRERSRVIDSAQPSPVKSKE